MGHAADGAQRGLLLVVSGPSGVGKTTIVRELIRRLEGCFSVSATTRPQRPGETAGRDYYFLNVDEFMKMKDRGEFLEYAHVFGTDWYGTPAGPVREQLEAGETVILDIDVQGALQVKAAMDDACLVFIEPPDDTELLRRLRKRAREDEATIQRRFDNARREMTIARECGKYDAFIVNDEVDRAVEEVCRIAESHRSAV